jgi:hypothetical protein
MIHGKELKKEKTKHQFTNYKIIKLNIYNMLKSPNDGYLGSCIDDERSKSRKVV